MFRTALPLILAALLGPAAVAQEAAPAPISPPPASPPMIRKPVWEELPPVKAIDKAYPQAAFDQGIGGKVVLACKVLDTGRLDGCTARSETPAGQGFAEAALSLVPGFKMAANTADGQPTAGGTVRLPIQFSPPQGATEGADGVAEVSPVQISPGGFSDGRGPKIGKPEWVRKPSGEAVNRAYPKAALSSGVNGRVTLSCVVTATGAVVDCKVIAESPPKYGFGEASIYLSRYFQMKPKTTDGQPVGGATVIIPLSFTSPYG